MAASGLESVSKLSAGGWRTLEGLLNMCNVREEGTSMEELGFLKWHGGVALPQEAGLDC